jgi:hydroxymethylbilane synthase
VVGATLLALAGLRRLGLEAHVSGEIPPESLLPAVAQGAIGIERREDDPRIAAFLAPLDHGETRIRVETERALLAILDGSCRTPIAALAEIIDPTTMRLRGLIVRPDGSASHAFDGTAPLAEARWLGRRAGETLLREAGPEFLAEIIDRPEPDQPVA